MWKVLGGVVAALVLSATLVAQTLKCDCTVFSEQTSEQWRAVVGYEGYYEVSDFGRVRSVPRVAIRKNGVPFTVRGTIRSMAICTPNIYLAVTLYRNGVGKTFTIHRLVALAFVENPNNYTDVDHRDRVATNNHSGNLRWCTDSSNLMNQDQAPRGKNPVKGVWFDGDGRKRPWNAMLGKVRIGRFSSQVDAIAARKTAFEALKIQ